MMTGESNREAIMNELRGRHGVAIMDAYNLGLETGETWVDRIENELPVRRFAKATGQSVPAALPPDQETAMQQLVLEGRLDGAEHGLTMYRCGFADAVDLHLRDLPGE